MRTLITVLVLALLAIGPSQAIAQSSSGGQSGKSVLIPPPVLKTRIINYQFDVSSPGNAKTLADGCAVEDLEDLSGQAGQVLLVSVQTFTGQTNGGYINPIPNATLNLGDLSFYMEPKPNSGVSLQVRGKSNNSKFTVRVLVLYTTQPATQNLTLPAPHN
jgi:hypothetical protein